MNYDVSFQTVAWFNERSNDESLEISPKFQRRAVWLEKERVLLLDTILSQLPFPEIYIHVETDPETGKQKYAVVDGQQRITSILKFINNEFSLPNNDTWSGEYFRDLAAEIKSAFWDYKIVVRSLRQASDDEIRSLFTKLNTNNIALNDQELRNARYTGRFKELAERLADNPFFQTIGLFTPRDVRRMLDIEYVSELLVRQVAGVTNKKDLLDSFYIQFDEEFPMEATYEDEFNICINLSRSLININNQTVFKSKGNFYSLFGMCVEYYRNTGKIQFQKIVDIQHDVNQLVNRAKVDDFDAENPDIKIYSEVSTRSTSDKSRRVERERILLSIIRKIEGF
ncbi:conserved hypothetical protein [Candidatus Nitrotoga sp. BS]|uniref:DUF262 domain-containing protein n=1 Tax=Candidatus Nitrotoga sp. BS TaxID=2890408 RepID=UPI001EF1E039|nr:DUF262 domain-containing protein [Candidatus Nitrotoga sp. BS]CAH1209773.1 conserved hypothetical protein [Candidatus Nitrotoga sp. BS]